VSNTSRQILTTTTSRLLKLAGLSTAALMACAATAVAAPSVPPGYTITQIASAPVGATLPDDITQVDGLLYVGYQNGVPSTGPASTGPQDSTLVAYKPDGRVVRQWQLRGKIDGLAGDPRRHRVILTVNEDNHSALYVVQVPGTKHSGEVFRHSYRPQPDAKSTGGLSTGGGTDAVSVLPDGTIVVSASAPSAPNATAAFKVILSAKHGNAHLKPTFADNATATSALTGKPVTLALTDPDSNAVVPAGVSPYGGQFVLASQADQQLVFAKSITGHTFGPANLTQLPLSHASGTTTTAAGIDDVRWTAATGGTLYIVDQKAGNGAVYKVTGPFKAGEAFASLDTVGKTATTTEVDRLDVSTGLLSPFVTGLGAAKGLVWVG
jgi:hypothetical protein